MRRIVESVKSILIVLLTLSMLFMSASLMSNGLFAEGTGSIEKTKGTFLTGLGLSFLSDFFDDAPGNVNRDFSPGSLIIPYAVAYKSGDTVTGVVGDSSEAAYMFDNVSSSIAGYMTGEIEQSPLPFERYLENDGTLIDFGRALPMDIVCRLVTGTLPGSTGLAVEKLFICQNGEAAYAVFTDGQNTYTFEQGKKGTPVMKAGSELIDAASLAAEGINVKKGSVVPSSQEELPVIYRSNELYNKEAGNYSFSNLSSILTVFGINSGSLNNEIKDDGSIIYVENRRSIRVGSDGAVAFSAFQDNGGVSLAAIIGESDELGYSVRDVLMASQRFLSLFDGDLLGGDALLRLKNAYFDAETGGYVTEFEFCFEGISLAADSLAARLVYKNGYFISAEISFEKYTRSEDESVTLEKLSNLLRLCYGRDGVIDKIRIGYIGEDTQIPQYCFYWS